MLERKTSAGFRLAAAALLMLVVAAPMAARAQVVVLANGSPITELDIEQRTKLLEVSTHKQPSRKEVINALIDDRIKIAKAKSYGFEVGASEVDESFNSMAQRQGISPQQFSQMLDHAGVTANALKAKIRADLTWQQLVRGRYQSSLQIGDSDVALALKSTNENEKDSVGYVYTLYPIILLVPSGSSGNLIEAKRREADNLRGRFVNCNDGLTMARALRDVAVRDPITKSSADLPEQMRGVLASVELGHLTTPDVTPQGLQMFAVCSKKESTIDSPAKREARAQIFNKRFEAESNKFLEEIRKQAMIEYK